MNGAHWHLLVNHLPINFPIVGVIVMITGLVSKSDAVKRTAFMIFIFWRISHNSSYEYRRRCRRSDRRNKGSY